MAEGVSEKISILFDDKGTIKKITREIKNFEMSIHGAGQKMNTMQNVGKQLMTRFFGITAIIGLSMRAFQELQKWVGESIKEFRSFQTRIAEVSSILTNTTREVLPSLESGITSLSVKYGQSVDDLTKGLYEIISAAFDVKDAMNLLNVVTKASIAGLTTVTGAVRTFTGVLNAYGLSAAHAQKLSDQLFTAVVRGNFTFADLESALGYVVPIAAEAGVAFEEVASALTTATRQGQHIDSVTRGLGLMIQNIINPTKEAADAAKEYGIDMTATALRVNGLKGFLNELSEATKKYGSQILPELIGNMRSLRVAMALTSESGIGGFIEDMGLMETATGRTDEALNQIMQTQQTLANIMDQTMKQIERGIGESWSGFDLWIKKTQIWWGTLFSGGDAGKAVRTLEQSIANIYTNAFKAANAEVDKNKQTKPLFDRLFSSGPKNITEMRTILKEGSRFSDLKEYLNYTEQIESAGKEALALDKLKTGLLAIDHTLQAQEDTIRKDISNHKEMDLANYVSADILEGVAKAAKEANANVELTWHGMSYWGKAAMAVGEKNNEVVSNVESLKAIQDSLMGTVNDVSAAFEDAADTIEAYESNIVTLNSEINKITESIPALQQQLLELTVGTKLDRFEHYANLAADYGEKYITEYTNVFDEYGNNMSDVIKTIYEYNEAAREQKIAVKELEKANNDLQIAMAKNNLEMLKLQLAGMMRRRGNTRAEQRMMKNLQIENTKLRIDQMKQEIDIQESNDKELLDEKEIAAEKAQAILDEYVAAERHNFWLISDTRDADIADLAETISEQEGLLEERKTMLTTQINDLANLEKQYDAIILKIAASPELKDTFEKITGIDTTQAASSAIMNAIDESLGPAKVFNPFRTGRGFQGGTHSVPETGFYMLHKNESVSPAGKEVSSGGGNITVNINNPIVKDDYDVAKLARAFENVLRANLQDKRTGKNKYRMM